MRTQVKHSPRRPSACAAAGNAGAEIKDGHGSSARRKAEEAAAENGIVRVELPPKLIPVFSGQARYRGAYGGRGSGKTRSFAKMAAIRGLALAQAGKTGLIVSGREFMNALSDSSLAEVKYAIRSEPWLNAYYNIGENYVRTKDGRIAFAFIGLRRNLDSVKSKARIHLLWADEAEHISEAAWSKIIPTVREPESEIWISWNPESPLSATHKRFRANPPDNAKIAELNWRDNPWFPAVLNAERQLDKEMRPDSYPHIWEGEFAAIIEGAYYAKALQTAKEEGRIGAAAPEPLMEFQAFWDIGGTGARSDATSIWIAQFIGEEIRIIDYYEAQGQPLAAHIDWLRQRGYGEGAVSGGGQAAHNVGGAGGGAAVRKLRMILPHDGSTRDRVHDVSFESALRLFGFDVEVIPNQGAGAARLRIEAARRLFPKMRFDAEKCAAGLAALAAYHEKRDANRNIGLGPEHDWASHAADAFGLMCIAYEEPRQSSRNSLYGERKYRQSSWMAG